MSSSSSVPLHNQKTKVMSESDNSSRRSSVDSNSSRSGRGTGTSISARPEEVAILHPVMDYNFLTSKLKNDARNFVMKIEIPNFSANEIDVRLTKTLIQIIGKHIGDHDQTREYFKECTTPPGVKPYSIQCLLNEEGVLTLVAPIERAQGGTKT